MPASSSGSALVDQFVCGDLECRCLARSPSISSASRTTFEDLKEVTSVDDSQIVFPPVSSNGSDTQNDEFPRPQKVSIDVRTGLETSFVLPSLRAPPNFGIVSETIYRGSFPKPEHFEYLKSLNLKSILCLVSDEYPQENLDFMKRNGIIFYQVGMPGNKQDYVPKDKVIEALKIIVDERNHPLLIHCNRGKHRTGCVVASLRKLQQWATQSALEEYSRYAHPKEREMDCQFICSLDRREVWDQLDTTNLPGDLGLCCDEYTPSSSSPNSEPSSSALVFSRPWSVSSGHDFTFSRPPLAFNKPFYLVPTPSYIYLDDTSSISGSSEGSSPTGELYFKAVDGDNAPPPLLSL